MYSSSISNINNTNLIYNSSRSHTPERVAVRSPENSLEVIPCQNLGGASAEMHIETATYVYNRHGYFTWNNAEALYNRAGQYDEPEFGFNLDYFLDLRNSADLGNVEAQYEFGLQFDYYMVNRGAHQRIPYLRLAADQGHVEAQFEYGRRIRDYYYEGPSNFRRFQYQPDFDHAEVYLQRAAQSGHVDAAIMYADLFTQPPQ